MRPFHHSAWCIPSRRESGCENALFGSKREGSRSRDVSAVVQVVMPCATERSCGAVSTLKHDFLMERGLCLGFQRCSSYHGANAAVCDHIYVRVAADTSRREGAEVVDTECVAWLRGMMLLGGGGGVLGRLDVRLKTGAAG